MLITLTGPTGSGKSTLAQELIKQGVVLVPTWTTRDLRKSEIGRGDVVQVSRTTLLSSDMLEMAEYDGHFYGTPVTEDVKAALAGEKVALKILEPQGLALVVDKLDGYRKNPELGTPQAAHVYVNVDGQTARRRIMARCNGMPSSADQRRLDRANDECRQWPGLLDWTCVVDNSKEDQDGQLMANTAWQLLKALGVTPHGPTHQQPSFTQSMSPSLG